MLEAAILAAMVVGTWYGIKWSSAYNRRDIEDLFDLQEVDRCKEVIVFMMDDGITPVHPKKMYSYGKKNCYIAFYDSEKYGESVFLVKIYASGGTYSTPYETVSDVLNKSEDVRHYDLPSHFQLKNYKEYIKLVKEAKELMDKTNES